MNGPIEYFDTHAHIHFPDYGLDAEQVWQSAKDNNVGKMLAVGCRPEDSKGAIEFARHKEGIWAAAGIHPHEAAEFLAKPGAKTDFEALLQNIDTDKIVAIGECGLDYFYNHSDKPSQQELLEFQLELAGKYNLPVIFHVRDAFKEFWPIIDSFSIKKAVIHSFTGLNADVGQILKRDLYIGLNGIVTFSKSHEQLEAIRQIPLEKILLETDAPYLTPKPFRGKICKPEHVKLTAAFLAELRGDSVELLAKQTTENAQTLFNL